VDAAAAGVGADVAGLTAGLPGRAGSSTGPLDCSSVMMRMTMAREATAPKISVPPPSRLTTDGSASSGFLNATSGA
jgi:hypothetical protein